MSDLNSSIAKLRKPKSTQMMVDDALKHLNDRNGSSLVAVKKFIACNYDVDVEASLKRIKKYIKASLESGKYVKTSGKGMSGSFKVSTKFKGTLKPKVRLRHTAKELAAGGDKEEKLKV